jgi:Icc-related predicted phosphoesterase
MHEPPSGTPLTVKSGPVSGNPSWNEAIEQFSPWLVVAGHDHRTPIQAGQWHATVAQSHIINVGQTDAGPLHYAVIEARFPESTESLPISMKVTAYPKGETLSLPSSAQ